MQFWSVNVAPKCLNTLCDMIGSGPLQLTNCKHNVALLVSPPGINVYWAIATVKLQASCCATCITTGYQRVLGHCNWNYKHHVALLVSPPGINVYWAIATVKLQAWCCATCTTTGYQRVLGHCNWQIASIMLRYLYHHRVSACIGLLQLTQIASIMLRYLYHHLVSMCMGPLDLLCWSEGVTSFELWLAGDLRATPWVFGPFLFSSPHFSFIQVIEKSRNPY
jgi:hypothetical protein